LKLVDAATGDAALGCFVSANDRGFDALGPGDELGKPDPAGHIISKSYDHLAFVQITQGGDAPLRIPAPITEPLCEHVVKLTVDPDAGAKSDFDRELRFLVQDVRTLKAVQDSGVEESNELSTAKRYEDAVRRVQVAIDAVTPLASAAESSLNRLATEADKIAQSDKPLLKWVTGQVKEVRDRQGELEKLVTSLDNAIAQRNAQANADRLKEQARQAEQEVDIDEAIARYELALAEQPDQPLLRKYLEDLKEAWRIKNPAHEQARKLINERWAAAEVSDLEQLLPEVKVALETLKKEQDRYGMLRLMKVNDQHLAAVVDVVQQADARGGEADLEESKKYAAFVDEIASFNEEVAQAVSAAPAPGTSSDSSPPPENAPAEESAPQQTPPSSNSPSPPVNLPPGKEEEPL
jgi:hypothetical protein